MEDRVDQPIAGQVGVLKRFRFIGAYVLFWIVLFEISRLIFIAYQWGDTSGSRSASAFGALWYGLKLDLSVAFAVSIIPACVAARAGFITPRTARRLILGYSVPLIFLAALAISADLELYAKWGTRLDLAPLLFLRTPREAFASASSSPLVLLAAFALLLSLVAIFALVRWILPLVSDDLQPAWLQSIAMMVAALFFVIPIRGGIQHVPLTQSSVYFSRNHFANQAAINPVWNLAASALSDEAGTARYAWTTESDAARSADSLLESKRLPGKSEHFVHEGKPNVLIILWEGFTAKAVEPLGGRRGVTPNFARLAKDGVLFDGLYASGKRTAVGLTAILSGFPSQPMATTIESASKSAALPSLAKVLNGRGYNSGFYYGGQLELSNIKRYLIDAGFDRIIGKDAFERRDWRSQWGVHDEVLFDRVLEQLRSTRKPWFTVVLTQSSHEPFDVPMAPVISGKSPDVLFLNSLAYTDRSLGNFIEKARNEAWWDNTVVIITGDHGNPYPRHRDEPLDGPSQYHVPMLWLGGAVAVKDTVVKKIMGQTDIAPTLAGALGVSSSQFPWGRDVLARSSLDFAYYAFQNGFGIITARGALVFDNASERIMYKRGEITGADVSAGRSFQQASVSAYHRLGALAPRR